MRVLSLKSSREIIENSILEEKAPLRNRQRFVLEKKKKKFDDESVV